MVPGVCMYNIKKQRNNLYGSTSAIAVSSTLQTNPYSNAEDQSKEINNTSF